jgi:DHA3 family multidrug efflux protein-like MFS transporter
MPEHDDQSTPEAAQSTATQSTAALSTATQSPVAVNPPPNGMRTFLQVLVNTAVANLTTSYLWFALTFWVYLETRSVLATGIIGGAYMLLVALFGMVFGTIVDRRRKHQAMIMASTTTLIAFVVAGVVFITVPQAQILNLGGPWFWIFTGIILFGGVIENMRNIALSTTVTLLLPPDRHANANGLVGTVTGLAFIVTSVFSGLSVGLLGMGTTLLIAIVFTAIVLAHLLALRIPEEKPHVEERAPVIDVRGALAAIRLVPGLFALIIFSTFNNLIGGVYMALMDPYGIDMFGVEGWGILFGVAATGFVVGGLIIAKFGLGKNPIRTMLMLVALMGILGATFTIREWWPLYAIGIWIYMAMIPAVEAAEQTVIQRVVPYTTQGRVFGFAQAFEAAAAPVTAFMIAPIAEFLIIPYMDTPQGQQTWGWLLGEGQSRGIALVFLFAGLIMTIIAVLALLTPAYRRISAQYESVPIESGDPEQPDDAAADRANVAGVDAPEIEPALEEAPSVTPPMRP